MEKLGNKFLDIVQDYIRYVNRSVKEMCLCVDAWTKGDKPEMEKKLALVTKIEKDADAIKYKLIKDVAEAETFLFRSDMLRLILQIDEIVDYAEGTSVRITRIDYSPSEKLAMDLNDLCDEVMKTIQVLRSALLELPKNPTKAIKHCEALDVAERRVDGIFRDLETNLFADLSMDVRILLQLRSVAYHLEDMGDIAERAGDAIRIIACTR